MKNLAKLTKKKITDKNGVSRYVWVKTGQDERVGARKKLENKLTDKKEGNTNSKKMNGIEFWDKYSEIFENAGEDLGPKILSKMESYMDKHDLGMEGKYQEGEFDDLPNNHKTKLIGMMEEAYGKYKKGNSNSDVKRGDEKKAKYFNTKEEATKEASKVGGKAVFMSDTPSAPEDKSWAVEFKDGNKYTYLQV